MLPRPVAFASTRRSPWTSLVLSRSRVTNLAVYLLGGALLLSLAVNFRQWNAAAASRRHKPMSSLPLDSSLETSFSNASHLIIVAGHAIYAGCQGNEWQIESNWVLQEHQKGTHSVETFYSHITKGVNLLRADPHGILIFSGGLTRRSHPIQTEAQSYLALAIANKLLDRHDQSLSRAFTEDYALDSFQNLLFSVTRYHELSMASGIPNSNSWPSKITVVGFEMKRRRFEQLHRLAIKWPNNRFEYVGVDLLDADERAKSWEGENQYGYQPYLQDLYGCHTSLAAKRKSRNPYAKFHPYHVTNPELAALLNWCPSKWGTSSSLDAQVYPGTLPWSS